MSGYSPLDDGDISESPAQTGWRQVQGTAEEVQEWEQVSNYNGGTHCRLKIIIYIHTYIRNMYVCMYCTFLIFQINLQNVIGCE